MIDVDVRKIIKRRKLFQEGESSEKSAIQRIKKNPPRGGIFGEKLIKKACDRYIEAGNLGHIQAMHNLSNLYKTILKYEPGSKEKAIHWKAKEHFAKGNECFLKGDYSGAFSFYEEAAEVGLIKAIKKLADMYERGNGVEPNLKEAQIWLEKVINKNYKDNEAKYKLAKILEKLEKQLTNEVKDSKEIEENGKKRFKLLKEVADSCDTNCRKFKLLAAFEIGKKYYEDYEKSQEISDLFEAKKYLKMAMEYNLDEIREYYNKVENSYFEYLKKKHEEKNININGLKELAKICNNKGMKSEEKKYSDEIEFIRQKKLANEGSANAMYEIAEKFLNGVGTEKNEKEALKYLEKAVNTKNDSISEIRVKAKANDKLGEIYEETNEIEKALKYYEEAIKWYKEAANRNDIKSMKTLAVMYEKQGTVKSDEEALKWYKKAAERNDIEAMMKVVSMYEKVKSDEEKTLEWYKKAAGIIPKEKAKELIDKCFDLGEKNLECGKRNYKDGKSNDDLWKLKEAQQYFEKAKNYFEITKKYDIQNINDKLQEIGIIMGKIEGYINYINGKRNYEDGKSNDDLEKLEEAKKYFEKAKVPEMLVLVKKLLKEIEYKEKNIKSYNEQKRKEAEQKREEEEQKRKAYEQSHKGQLYKLYKDAADDNKDAIRRLLMIARKPEDDEIRRLARYYCDKLRIYRYED